MASFRDDLVAWRHAPFGGAAADQDWVFVAENLTGATAKMQVRFTPGDTTTTPLVNLANVSSAVQGLLITWNPTFPDPDTGSPVGGSVVRPQIDRTTLEAIALGADPTQPQVFAYDLHITPSGGVETLRAFGSFTLNPGVTY
jgi:hypothetical protein